MPGPPSPAHASAGGRLPRGRGLAASDLRRHGAAVPRLPRCLAGERPPRAAPSAFSCCCATGLQKSPSRSQLPRSSDHSSAWLASASGPQPPPPPPPPARPARILVCSVRREAVGTRAPLGQVIYDARRPPPSHPWKSPAWLQ
ncbi:uncharacterized protein LOC143825838 isoform X2 [Paroedura picta]|uniref:uncharacterized protein LOC143825838 isoform X2 n=1 Tax=Paroedura picta TaxID=143630 RepID=UPI004055CC32